jgi:AcrR family transcriptional regulator
MVEEPMVHDKRDILVQQRRGEILAAARNIFAKKGFAGTTIDDVADSLKVGKGTIYRYFADKKHLFIAVFENGMRGLRATIRNTIKPITDPAEKITLAIKTYLEFYENQPELIEIMMQVRSEFKDDYERVHMDLYNDYIVDVKDNLRAGIEKGIFRQMDVDKTAEIMSGTMQGFLQSFYMREFGEENASRSKLIDSSEAIRQFMLDGLLKREEKEPADR